MKRVIFWFDNLIDRLSLNLLTLTIFFMMAFSLATIFLRFFNLNYPWFESLVRHLVLLSAFLGGVVATGKGTHIGIDIVSKYLESNNLKKTQLFLARLIHVVSFLTVCWLVKAGIDFTKVELEFGTDEFLGLKSGHLVTIIPIGFSLIALRILLKFLTSFEQEKA